MAFDAFALILTMLGLGMAFSRLRALPENTADVLNRIVLYVCLPAAVLIYVPRLHLDTSLIGLVATPWLLMLCTLALVSLATRAFGFARDVHAVLLICVALANSSFIGYPMVRALLGDHALPYAVVYDQFGTFVLLSTFGLYVIARYSGDTPPTAAQILLRIAKFPPLWALLFALTLMPEQPPGWIGTGLKQLADAMLPLVMLAVGFSIQLRLPLDELKPLGIGFAVEAAGDAGAGAADLVGVRPAGCNAAGQCAGVGDADHDHRRRAGDVTSPGPAPGCRARRLRHPAVAGDAAGVGVGAAARGRTSWIAVIRQPANGQALRVRADGAPAGPLAQRGDLLGHQHRQRPAAADLLHQQLGIQPA